MGEPTLHPSLPLFIRRAREKGFFPMVTTNGSLLPKVKDALLSDLPHKISISLHDAAANPAFANAEYLESCADFARRASVSGCITVLRLWNLGSEDEKTNTDVLSYLKSVFTDEWKSVRNGDGYKLADKLFIEYGERFDWPDASESETDAIICKELSQDSKAARQSREASQTRRTRADRDAQRLRNAVECLRKRKR